MSCNGWLICLKSSQITVSQKILFFYELSVYHDGEYKDYCLCRCDDM